MTIVELDFFHNRRSLLRVNIYARKFYSELCAGITDKEMNEMKIQIADGVIVYKPIIKKIWDACIEHGYISHRNDYLECQVNRITLTSW